MVFKSTTHNPTINTITKKGTHNKEEEEVLTKELEKGKVCLPFMEQQTGTSSLSDSLRTSET